MRLIAEKTQIPQTSVWRTLTSDMELIFRNPIVLPHFLSEELKAKRAQKSIELLKVLEGPKFQPHKIITGDESWIEWMGRVTGKWQSEDEPPPISTRISQTIKKTMIIEFFSFSKIFICYFL